MLSLPGYTCPVADCSNPDPVTAAGPLNQGQDRIRPPESEVLIWTWETDKSSLQFQHFILGSFLVL